MGSVICKINQILPWDNCWCCYNKKGNFILIFMNYHLFVSIARACVGFMLFLLEKMFLNSCDFFCSNVGQTFNFAYKENNMQFFKMWNTLIKHLN